MSNRKVLTLKTKNHNSFVLTWERGYTPMYKALCSCGWRAPGESHEIKRIAVEEMWEHAATGTSPDSPDTAPNPG